MQMVKWVDPVSVVTGMLLLALALVLVGLGLGAWRARREARALELTLFWEVRDLRRQAADLATEIARRHRAGEQLDERFFGVWRLSAPLIYPSIGAALTQLPGASIGYLGYFHGQLADARARLAEARESGRFEPTSYRILSNLVRSSNHVQPWCERQQRRLGPRIDDDRDLSDANALLGEFENAALEPIAVAYCWVDCAHHE